MREEKNKTIRFIISEKKLGQYSMNELYAGGHWSKRKREAEYWHRLTQLEMRSQGIKKRLLKNPVYIRFCFNTAMDVDNHGYLVKMIIDGMKGYLIQDDSKKYVKGYSVEFHSGKGILVEVSEFESENKAELQ